MTGPAQGAVTGPAQGAVTSAGAVGQRNAGAVTGVGRVPELTGVRALAAILVLATHAAYTTGKYTHGYLGVVY